MECIIVQTSNKAKAFLKEMLAAGPPLIPPAAIIPSTSAIHAYIRHSLKGLSVRHATVNSNLNYKCFYYWGEPERAPHIHDICKFCLSVCLSVGLYVHNTIIYKCYSNLQIPSIVDCSFEQYASQTVLYPNN